MATLLIPLLLNRMVDDKTTVALYATLSQLLATLAQGLTGQASDRWGSKGPTLVGFGALILSALGLALFNSQLWGIFFFGILGACAAWSLATLIPVLVAAVTGMEERGRVLGTLHFVWNTSMMVGALVSGLLVEMMTGLPFLVAAAVNLGAILTTLAFFRRIPKPTDESERVVPGY
jgi:MFS family permease